MTKFIKIFDTILSWMAYYGIVIIGLLLLGGTFFHFIPLGELQEFFAEKWWALLVIILFIKPLSNIPKRYLNAQYWKFADAVSYAVKWWTQDPILIYIKNILINGIYSLSLFLMRWRKQLGILCFWFIFLHWILLEIANYQAKMPSLILHPNLFIWMGVIGLIALFIGYITSNLFSLKLLKWRWKLVQQIAYVAFIGAGIHIFLFKQDWSILILLLIYSVLKFFEWKKRTPLIPVSTPVSTPTPNMPTPEATPLTWKVINHRMLTDNVMELTLETNQAVSIIPGQRALFQLADKEGPFNRSYSIVDDDTDNDKTVLIFVIKLNPEGRASQFFQSLKIGESFPIRWIYGKFILQDTPNPKVFIGTWTGIAPLLHMASHCNAAKTFLYSVSYFKDIFYEDRLKKIDSLSYEIHITREEHEGYASGRIQLTAESFSPDTEFYVCGGPPVVASLVEMLAGLWYKNILSEKF